MISETIWNVVLFIPNHKNLFPISKFQIKTTFEVFYIYSPSFDSENLCYIKRAFSRILYLCESDFTTILNSPLGLELQPSLSPQSHHISLYFNLRDIDSVFWIHSLICGKYIVWVNKKANKYFSKYKKFYQYICIWIFF